MCIMIILNQSQTQSRVEQIFDIPEVYIFDIRNEYEERVYFLFIYFVNHFRKIISYD